MSYIPKIDEYLKILTYEEVKDFLIINFRKFRGEEQILRKVAKSLYFFLTTPGERQSNCSDNFIYHCNVNILNIFYSELQLINTKPVTKNKLIGLLNKLEKFKFQRVLVLRP